MELICALQQYSWGVKGKLSSVAQLAQASQVDVAIDDSTPYAELWMGTHPNGPSLIKGTKRLLSSYIQENPECLGKIVTSKFGPNLPFLFKVLSVNQALSIQAHPNKSHAEELHASRPDVYKDPNHKPEMTIALTPFLALCGFRPQQEIVQFFQDIPELVSVVGRAAAEEFSTAPSASTLQACFSGLMRASKDVVEEALVGLEKRLLAMGTEDADRLHASTFLKTLSQYPGDGGCFALYLLNLIELQPGQAMFLGPNVIHAYLHGDCVECMACSDNVVRAGLTPKYQDVDTLIAMLEYQMSDAHSRIFKPTKLDASCELFNPPVPDFAVEAIKVASGKCYSVRSVDSCSLLLVVQGAASVTASSPAMPAPPASVVRGSVLFLPANYSITVEPSQDLVAFRALCEP
ncbi:mannose-6-phosphate isomerase-like [Hyalella azteca]|uniref:Mannose-6-phosphate isomerase n=1 Tax=Hyalella azteca TaxID=294128 RepID=A0A8B7NRZ2_HYAAZ|nr:mannose-6-phosphate isomerase-like [Hyalella azteca]